MEAVVAKHIALYTQDAIKMNISASHLSIETRKKVIVR